MLYVYNVAHNVCHWFSVVLCTVRGTDSLILLILLHEKARLYIRLLLLCYGLLQVLME